MCGEKQVFTQHTIKKLKKKKQNKTPFNAKRPKVFFKLSLKEGKLLLRNCLKVVESTMTKRVPGHPKTNSLSGSKEKDQRTFQKLEPMKIRIVNGQKQAQRNAEIGPMF